jgi:hypothetical protein
MGQSDGTWAGISPGSITGFGAGYADEGSGGLTTGVESSVVTQAGAAAPLYSPDNPLFWFGVMLLAVAGLVTVSVHAKAGPANAGVTI